MNYTNIETILGYSFSNKSLLEQAFTRSSYKNENGGEDNETLEFFGDSIIGFVTTSYFLKKYKTITPNGQFKTNKNQMDLTDLKAEYVSKSALSSRMRILKLDSYFKTGKGDEKLDIIKQNSVLEDGFEAIAAAMFVDSGYNLSAIEPHLIKMLGLNECPNDELIEKVKTKYAEVMKSEKFPHVRTGYEDNQYVLRMPIIIDSMQFGSFEFKGETKTELLDNALTLLEKVKKGKLLEFIKKIKLGDANTAINTVQELEQKGFIKDVEYVYESMETPVAISWRAYATCSSDYLDVGNVRFGSHFPWTPGIDKKSAKKFAASALLTDLFDRETLTHLVCLAKCVTEVEEDFSDPQYMELAAQILAYQATDNEEMLDEYLYGLDWDLETIARVCKKLQGKQ